MFDDRHCAVCGNALDADTDDVRFQSDGQLVHTYPCGELRLFVYGTLRRGGWLEDRISRAWREPARLDGYALHYSPHHRGYPYMIASDGSTTHGELLTVLTDDLDGVAEVHDTTQMEEKAGYVTTPVRVRIKSGTVEAVAFVWAGKVGDQVPDNDWAHAPEWGVSPIVQDDDDDDPSDEYVIHSGGHPFITVTYHDEIVWEGSSYTALGRWAKEAGVTLRQASVAAE